VKNDVGPGLAAFLVGFVGWLELCAIHVEGEALYVSVFSLGLIAGTVGRWPLGPIALLAGIAASYPVLLATGVFASLGENLELYAVVFALIALAGFAAGNLIVRGRRRVEPSR
jgi:hypothetical protein